MQDFFMCIVDWSLLDNIAQGFYLCNVVPRVLRQHCTGFVFLCMVVWSLKDKIAYIIYLCKVVQGVLRQHWTWFLFHAILSFFQCWPKISVQFWCCICSNWFSSKKLTSPKYKESHPAQHVLKLQAWRVLHFIIFMYKDSTTT